MARAPGVYIEESASLSLSVRSAATAVPVFIGNFKRKASFPASANGDKCVAINSWLDFIKCFEGPTVAKVVLQDVTDQWKEKQKEELKKNPEVAIAQAEKGKKSEGKEALESTLKNWDQEVVKLLEADGATTFADKPAFILKKKVYAIKSGVDSVAITLNHGAFALQHYFINGGTSCYLLSVEKTQELPTLAKEIQKYPDISLLACVCAKPGDGVEDNLKIEKNAVYTSLNALLDDSNKNLGYFLLADSENGATKPSTKEAQTAVYYPNLVTTLKPSMPADAEISFTLEGGKSLDEIKTLVNLKDSKFEAFYQEVIGQLAKALSRKLKETPEIILPPSAAVAGAYARTDRERGVWKAPANVPLRGVARVATVVTDNEQAKMNEQGINVIRAFNGHGTLIWGARTLDRTDTWKYIPVRRLFNAAERDIKRAMQFAMFEANNQQTWEQVKVAIENYLYSLWRQGALLGDSEKEAYFVQIGKDITMTDTDIKQGRMIVKVGMAAVRPAEFIILQFTQNVT